MKEQAENSEIIPSKFGGGPKGLGKIFILFLCAFRERFYVLQKSCFAAATAATEKRKPSTTGYIYSREAQDVNPEDVLKTS